MDLSQRFSMSALFADFCQALAVDYDIARAGIARTDLINDEFILLAQWSQAAGHYFTPNRRFGRHGTVGDWVVRQRRGFIGHRVEDIARFPATLLDFEDEGLNSNIVEFIDPERQQLFFAVSRSERAFADARMLRERLQVLPHCIRLADHFGTPSDAESLRQRLEGLLHDLWDATGVLPTQRELERAYFRTLLDVSDGRIEGSSGAARIAGVKPSTLRSRMARALAEDPD